MPKYLLLLRGPTAHLLLASATPSRTLPRRAPSTLAVSRRFACNLSTAISNGGMTPCRRAQAPRRK
jgi:hypothetical protein